MIDNKWTFTEGDDWDNTWICDTKEEAIEYGLDWWKGSEWESLYIGRVKMCKISDFFNVDLLRLIGEEVDFEFEGLEDYLTDVSDEHEKELYDSISKILNEWADKYGYQPNMNTIEDVENIR